jgi:hypothetical protein
MNGKDNPYAGLDVSPAVRDYLSLNGLDICDWKFVDHPQPGLGATMTRTTSPYSRK